MYLPRIMMERHGWAGFLAFAVPNVIGCTAFGFVLRKPGAATALRTQIEGEAKWFSSATIAFHVLFAVFLVKSLLGEDGLSVPQSEAPVAAGAFLGAAFLLSLLPKSVFPWLGALVWVGSITLFGLRADTPITSAAPCDLNALWSLPLFTAVNSGNDHNAFKSHGAAEVMGVSALRPNKVMDPTHTNAPSQGKTDLGKRDSKKAAPKNAPAATGASLWGTDKPSSPSKLFTKNTANNTWNAMVAEENHLASPSI